MHSPLRLALIATFAGPFGTSATAGTLTAATWSHVIYGFPMTRTGTQLGITGSSTATSPTTRTLFGCADRCDGGVSDADWLVTINPDSAAATFVDWLHRWR
jgi:hypothetical protein